MAILKETPYDRAFRELNPCQLSVLAAMRQKQKLIAVMMPRQVGKTHFGIWAIRELMRQNTNAQAIFLAKDFPSITRNTQDKFLKLFPSEEFSVTTQGVKYHNPTQEAHRGMCFMSGVDRNPHKIRGGTMGFAHWSEVAFSRFEKGESFKTIHQTVVLPMISRTAGYYYMESTPHGSNFWKQFWEEDSRDPEALSRGFNKMLFPLDLCIALGAITREQADFMEKSMHPDVFKQEMMCLFVAFQGKLFSEFNPDRHHLADSFGPEPHEKVIVGIDVGHTAGFSALFATWRGKKLHIFDQIYQQGLRISQMADLIDGRIQHWGVERANYSAYTDHDVEMVEELRDRHVKVTLAEKTDPFAARMDIKDALFFDKIAWSVTRCQPLDKEVGAAVWSEKRVDEMEERGDPMAGHWDSEASLRYLWRGSKVELEKPEEMPDAIKDDQVSAEEWEKTKKRREIVRERERGDGPKGGDVFEH